MSNSAWKGIGRPDAEEAQRRKGKFLTLIADGLVADEAAVKAGVSLKRALRIASDPEFQAQVQAIRDDEMAA
jgi:hypothetical protein